MIYFQVRHDAVHCEGTTEGVKGKEEGKSIWKKANSLRIPRKTTGASQAPHTHGGREVAPPKETAPWHCASATDE